MEGKKEASWWKLSDHPPHISSNLVNIISLIGLIFFLLYLPGVLRLSDKLQIPSYEIPAYIIPITLICFKIAFLGSESYFELHKHNWDFVKIYLLLHNLSIYYIFFYFVYILICFPDSLKISPHVAFSLILFIVMCYYWKLGKKYISLDPEIIENLVQEMRSYDWEMLKINSKDLKKWQKKVDTNSLRGKKPIWLLQNLREVIIEIISLTQGKKMSYLGITPKWLRERIFPPSLSQIINSIFDQIEDVFFLGESSTKSRIISILEDFAHKIEENEGANVMVLIWNLYYACQQDASVKLWKDIKEEYISKWVMIITIAGAFCAIILLVLKILGR